MEYSMMMINMLININELRAAIRKKTSAKCNGFMADVSYNFLERFCLFVPMWPSVVWNATDPDDLSRIYSLEVKNLKYSGIILKPKERVYIFLKYTRVRQNLGTTQKSQDICLLKFVLTSYWSLEKSHEILKHEQF